MIHRMGNGTMKSKTLNRKTLKGTALAFALTLAAFASSLLAGCQVSSTQGVSTSNPFLDRHHSKGRDD